MNLQQWYLYKNKSLIAGPTHFMGAVAAMNRLNLLSYPGNNVFQRTKRFQLGSDVYELSQDIPAVFDPSVNQKANTQFAQSSHTSQPYTPLTLKAAKMQHTFSTPLMFPSEENPAIVAVRFVDERNEMFGPYYHFYSAIRLKADDYAVVLNPTNSLKIVRVVDVTHSAATPTKWIIDKIDMTAHRDRQKKLDEQRERESRIAEIRRTLDAKLTANQDAAKYAALQDDESMRLRNELNQLGS